MIKIKFLGSGGGRFTTITQKRATGGFYIDSKEVKIYVDPGPGALIHALNQKIPLSELDIIFVSHAHTDHINDLSVLIEALSKGCRKKKGIFVGSISAVNYLDEYHKKCLEKVVPLKYEEKFEYKNVVLNATKALHTDKTTIGFVLDVEDKKIGYMADSVFFEGFAEQFKNCDLLIVNCAVPKNPYKHMGVEKAKHMDAFDAVKLLKTAKPKIAVLNHYGISMLKAKPENIAKFIEKESGIKTKAIKDFEEIKI